MKSSSWLGPWSGLTHCEKCHALMSGRECPICCNIMVSDEFETFEEDGRKYQVPVTILQGALSWTAHSLLDLMRREWERPGRTDDLSDVPMARQCSDKVLVVVLFWTLFEHLMDVFFRSAVGRLPDGVGRDLLKRYQGIGSRMDHLYKILFGAKLSDDLDKLGHGRVWAHLQLVQAQRNAFIHGVSEAVDDALVGQTVARLTEVQSAWLALYNYRCTGDPNVPAVFEDKRHRDFVAANKGKS